jgi:hypothetical protein
MSLTALGSTSLAAVVDAVRADVPELPPASVLPAADYPAEGIVDLEEPPVAR